MKPVTINLNSNMTPEQIADRLLDVAIMPILCALADRESPERMLEIWKSLYAGLLGGTVADQGGEVAEQIIRDLHESAVFLRTFPILDRRGSATNTRH